MGAPNLKITPSERLAHLRACAIFNGVNDAFLDQAASACEALSFRAGDSIILENEANSAVYFVLRGTVEIASYLPDEKRMQRLVLLKPGSHFGEFSVLTKTSRSSSAHANEDCELLRMDGAQFLALLEASADVAQNLMRHLAKLTESSLANEVIPLYNDASPMISPQILEILPAAQWKKLGVVPISMKAGLLSIAMKDPHHSSFFSQMARDFSKLELSVSIVSEHRFESLVDFATAASKNATAVKIQASKPAMKLEPLAALKASLPFSSFEDDYLQQLLPHARVEIVRSGATVLQRGAGANEFFIVMSGSFLMSRPVSGSNSLAQVMTLKAGDVFGESQLAIDSKATASVRAMEDSEVIAVPKEVVTHLLSHSPFVIDLARSLAEKLQTLGHLEGLKFLPANVAVDVERVATRLPLSLIDESKAIPLMVHEGEVTIGLLNADSSQVISRFERYFSNERLRVVGISLEQFQTYRARLKSTDASTRQSAGSGPASKLQSVEKVDVLKWIDSVLAAGVKSGASDVHFEPGPAGLMTRFRVDGVLREYGQKLSTEMIPQMVNRLKIMSNMDISVQHLPQDGHLEANLTGGRLMARASSMPVKHGEKFVLRLIRERSSIVPIESIAPDRRIVNFLKSVAECRQGLFLVTGPTGSGKTTTLYSLLKVINQIDVNVISIEDPIEMEIAGVNQVEINSKRGVDFGAVLRSVLRQDPDVVMIGEIRDATSAKIVSEAASTGHLVISTLHAGTSFEAIHRLKELGLSSAQIAETVLGVVTQRLVRKVCKHCEREDDVTPSEAEMFNSTGLFTAPDKIKRGTGCAACGQTGYSGRIPVLETWGNNRTLRDAIRQDVPTAELQNLAREQGFEHLHEFGLRLVLSGLTTPEEIRRVLTGPETFS